MIMENHDKLMAFAFLIRADQNQSGKLVEDLANNFTMGENKYLRDITNAINMVSNHQNKVNNPNSKRINQNKPRD